MLEFLGEQRNPNEGVICKAGVWWPSRCPAADEETNLSVQVKSFHVNCTHRPLLLLFETLLSTLPGVEFHFSVMRHQGGLKSRPYILKEVWLVSSLRDKYLASKGDTRAQHLGHLTHSTHDRCLRASDPE